MTNFVQDSVLKIMKNAMAHFGPVISEIVGRRVNVLAAENDRTFGHLQEPTSIIFCSTLFCFELHSFSHFSTVMF